MRKRVRTCSDRGKAAPELHELLERKGFKFLVGPADDFYRFGKDDDWPDPYKQPLISVYKDHLGQKAGSRLSDEVRLRTQGLLGLIAGCDGELTNDGSKAALQMPRNSHNRASNATKRR